MTLVRPSGTRGPPPAERHAGATLVRPSGLVTVVGMSRHLTSATILLAVTALLAGCVPGLAADPRFATNSGARPQGVPATKPPASGPPPIAAPKNDLAWQDCTSRVFARRGRDRSGGRQAGMRELRRRPRPSTVAPGRSALASFAPARARRRTTPGRWSSPPAPTCRRRRSCRSGCPSRAPTCCKPTPSSPSIVAAWACPARSTAATASTAKRCAIRRSSSPATIRWPTFPTSRTPRPPTAPTPSRRQATPPTTTPTPPRISSGCASSGTYPRSRWSESATAPRWRWPTPGRVPTRWPD